MKQAIHAIYCFILAGTLSHAHAQDCPVVPDAPTLSAQDLAFRKSWTNVAAPYSVRDTTSKPEDVPLGVGYLRVEHADNSTNDLYYNWPRHVTLPLWSAPRTDAFLGWINGGRVHARDVASIPLTGIGMVETDYEHSSFIVFEKHGDWLRIRPHSEHDAAWTHVCHLNSANARLRYASWESFIGERRDWLHFRSKVPHVLRSRPDSRSKRIVTISLDHKLTMLEISGNWMRVQVDQPDWTCSGATESTFAGTRHEGWIKWRDAVKGPWVWVYTRGC